MTPSFDFLQRSVPLVAVASIGETVKVQVVKINKDTHRISLGMKQLQADPWDTVADKFPIGSVHTGRVTNITDYGAFVELEAGVEGLVHVSEMSWTKKNVHPGKIVSTSQEVDVMVLEIDEAKRRVSLGLKQTMRNPWEVFAETHPVGTVIEGEVKNITEFGLFVGLEGDIDGMVHLSDISWDTRGEEAIQDFRKGDVVKAVVQEVDIDKERISLSIKALENDAMAEAVEGVKRGSVITVTVTAIETGGIEVKFGEDDAPVTAFVRVASGRPWRWAGWFGIAACIAAVTGAGETSNAGPSRRRKTWPTPSTDSQQVSLSGSASCPDSGRRLAASKPSRHAGKNGLSTHAGSASRARKLRHALSTTTPTSASG